MVTLSELEHNGHLRRKTFTVSGCEGSGAAVVRIMRDVTGVKYVSAGVFVVSPSCSDPIAAWVKAAKIVREVNAEIENSGNGGGHGGSYI